MSNIEIIIQNSNRVKKQDSKDYKNNNIHNHTPPKV